MYGGIYIVVSFNEHTTYLPPKGYRPPSGIMKVISHMRNEILCVLRYVPQGVYEIYRVLRTYCMHTNKMGVGGRTYFLSLVFNISNSSHLDVA